MQSAHFAATESHRTAQKNADSEDGRPTLRRYGYWDSVIVNWDLVSPLFEGEGVDVSVR